MNSKWRIERYTLELVRCVLQNTQPPSLSADLSADGLFVFAREQKLASMLYYAVKKLALPPEILQQWTQYHYQALMTDVTQQTENDSLLKSFSDADFDVLSIKGFAIKKLYPQSDMREMGDIDLLLKEDVYDKARGIMESAGYSVDKYEDDAHDAYCKPPMMYVELHKSMVSQKFRYFDYYKDIWSKAKSVEGMPHVFELSAEDNFIFHLVHFAKHYYARGCGIRFVVDHFIFMKQYQQLDMDYISNELKKLELTEFFKLMNDIAVRWFGSDELPEQFSPEETMMFRSGIYGNKDTDKQTQMNALEEKYGSRKKAKRAYLLRRIFPSLATMRLWYPILKKLPILYPFLWVYRCVRVVLFRRDSLKHEIEVIENEE